MARGIVTYIYIPEIADDYKAGNILHKVDSGGMEIIPLLNVYSNPKNLCYNHSFRGLRWLASVDACHTPATFQPRFLSYCQHYSQTLPKEEPLNAEP